MKIDKSLMRRIMDGTCAKEELEAVHRLNAEGKLDGILAKLVEAQWDACQPTATENEALSQQGILEGIHKKMDNREVLPPPINANEQKVASASPHFDILYLAKVAAVLLIFVSSLWLIVVNVNKNQEQQELAATGLLHKSVSFGEKRTFYLPDGTKVMLNSGSELTYPESFGQETDRTVELRGEGFFEVARDIKKPFHVRTGSYVTTALGTSFNISSNQENLRVALATGKAKVSHGSVSVLLNPGEMADCNLADGGISKNMYGAEAVLGWKEGTIKFQSAGLTEVETLLERWYGVEMEVDHTLPADTKITGSFNNENLKSIVQGLCFTLNCHFQMDNKHVKIIKNQTL